jgi:catechol 2,3-dioxygenase
MAKPIDRRAEIGRVHLTVADLERAIAFYSGVLGFEVAQRMGQMAALLSAGGSHHHIRLSVASAAPDRRVAGPCEFAIRYPDRSALGDALRRMREAAYPIEAASDLGISEALFARDPDGHRVELYWERPRATWPREADGGLKLVTVPLDLDRLLAAAAPATGEADSPYALMSEANRSRLRDLRGKLLQLHKVLLDDARASYEMDRGRVPSSATLLQLVINDPWFAWLHALSELVVRIDQTVEPDSPAADADAAALIDQVERLLTASEDGEGFQRRYFDALQRQPAVVMAHADVRRAIKAMR